MPDELPKTESPAAGEVHKLANGNDDAIAKRLGKLEDRVGPLESFFKVLSGKGSSERSKENSGQDPVPSTPAVVPVTPPASKKSILDDLEDMLKQ